MRLFDFGLAKELKAKDLAEPPDGFRATGMTGSRRYMAPEVVLCKNYGLKADVYSYSIVFWEVFSGQSAYPKLTMEKHFEQTVLKDKRPSRRSCASTLPKSMIRMMEEMWSGDAQKRPTFRSICDQLGSEYVLSHHTDGNRSNKSHMSDRTSYLTNRSLRSRCESTSGDSVNSRISRAGN